MSSSSPNNLGATPEHVPSAKEIEQALDTIRDILVSTIYPPPTEAETDRAIRQVAALYAGTE